MKTIQDQRGITLQTLIVTAVLVLMAVAAGVAITAITERAADNTDQATPNITPHCNQVEIFSPTYAATNQPGVNAGISSIRRGCLPVCVWTAKRGDFKADNPIVANDLLGNLEFNSKLEASKLASVSSGDIQEIDENDRFLFTDVDTFVDIGEVEFHLSDVEVHIDNSNRCVVGNALQETLRGLS